MTKRHSIDDLRSHLFATLEALRDTEKPMEIDRARAVAEVAREVIASAKVEVEHIKATGSIATDFIPVLTKPTPPRPQIGSEGRQ